MNNYDFYKEYAESKDKLFQEKDVLIDPYSSNIRKTREAKKEEAKEKEAKEKEESGE